VPSLSIAPFQSGTVCIGALRERSGFAFGYAGTTLTRTQFEQELVGRPGLDLGERQRLVVVAEKVGRTEVGLRRPAGSAEMPRPKGASNPGPPDQKSMPCIIEVIENQYVAVRLNLALAQS
jgi:hypothetical protein